MYTTFVGALPTRIGPYRIRRELGSGGMGVVYEGEHEILHRRAAVKVLRAEHTFDAEVTRRFYDEARTAARLAHPGIVQIYDVGMEPPDTPYLAMEFLRGQSLAGRLRRLTKQDGRLSLLPLLLQVADALSYAHRLGVIHRDIKPENVFICAGAGVPGGEQAKVLDFGLAKRIRSQDIADWTLTGATSKSGGRGRTVEEVTKTGVGLGTPLFMPPEQWLDAKRADDKADAYAFGVMLYEVLSGRPPFVATDIADLLEHHLNDRPPPLGARSPGLPSELVELVESLLAKDPSQRPSMSLVAERLTRIIPSLPSPPPAPPAPDPADPPDLGRPSVDVFGQTPPASPAADPTPPQYPATPPEPDRPPPTARSVWGSMRTWLAATQKAPTSPRRPRSELPADPRPPRWQAADVIPLVVTALGAPLLLSVVCGSSTQKNAAIPPPVSQSSLPEQTAANPPEPPGIAKTPLKEPIPQEKNPTQNVGRANLEINLKRLLSINPLQWRDIIMPPVLAARLPACTTLTGEYQICLSPTGNVASVEPTVSIPWADRVVIDTLKTGSYLSSSEYGPGRCTREKILFHINGPAERCPHFTPLSNEPVQIEVEALSENMAGGIYIPPVRPPRIPAPSGCGAAVAKYEVFLDRSGSVSSVVPAPGLGDYTSDREVQRHIKKWRYRALAFPVVFQLAVALRRRAEDPPCSP